MTPPERELSSNEPLAYPAAGHASLSRNTVLGGFGQLAGLLGRVGALVIIAHVLGTDGVGRVAFLVWVTEFTLLLTNAGLPSAVNRYPADLKGRGRGAESVAVVRWAMRRNLLFATLGTVGLATFFLLSDNQEPREIWLVLVPLFLLMTMGQMYTALLSGQQRFDLAALISTISSALLVVLVLAGALTLGVRGVLLGYAVAQLPAALPGVVVMVCGGRSPPLASRLRRDVTRYAFFSWLAVFLSAFVWARLEIGFLQSYGGAVQVAYFTVCLSLATLSTQGPTMFLAPLTPRFAELLGRGDLAEARFLFSDANRRFALILFPLTLGTAALAPALIHVLYGEEFLPTTHAAAVMVVLSGATLAFVSNGLLHGLGRSRAVATANLGGAAVAMFSFLVLIPRWGVLGAAWGRGAAQAAVLVLLVAYLWRREQFGTPVRVLGGIWLAAAVGALPAMFAARNLPPISAILVGLPAAILLYTATVRVLGLVHPADVAILTRWLRWLGVSECGAHRAASWVLASQTTRDKRLC